MVAECVAPLPQSREARQLPLSASPELAWPLLQASRAVEQWAQRLARLELWEAASPTWRQSSPLAPLWAPRLAEQVAQRPALHTRQHLGARGALDLPLEHVRATQATGSRTS